MMNLSRFWRFSFFAQSRYHRTSSLARKRNSIPFLEVCQRVEIYNLTFSTRWGEHTLSFFVDIQKALLYYNNQLYNFANPSTENNEIQQKVSLNATKNNSVEITTVDSNNKLMIENYKFIKGTENTTSIVKKFNNSNKDNFIYNPDEIDFDDNNTCVKNKYVYDMKTNSDGLYESEVINKNDFLEISEVI